MPVCDLVFFIGFLESSLRLAAYPLSEVVSRITKQRHTVFPSLQGCQRVAEDWQRIIQVRSLVVSPSEDMNTWLKYASLCRKNGRLVR